MLRQIDWSSLTEHFIPQAVLGRPPDFFEKERLILFMSAEDSFDFYRGALLLKDDLTPIVLKQYRGSRKDCTTVYLSPDCQDLEYITRVVSDVVSDLGLQSADIVWQRKDNPEA